jgi:hypothetical protein
MNPIQRVVGGSNFHGKNEFSWAISVRDHFQLQIHAQIQHLLLSLQ